MPCARLGLLLLFLAAGCSPAPAPHPASAETAAAPPPVAAADAGPASTASPPADAPLAELPYTPALDPASLDRSVDPCDDLYAFACGGWQKRNPIPADESSWSVYGKLGNEVKRHLWGLLVGESSAKPRTKANVQLGDYFAACIDESTLEAKGTAPVRPALDALAAAHDRASLTDWLARGALEGGGNLLFALGSEQDADDSTRYVAFLRPRGLGLPDRDDYLTTSDKAAELRERYRAHLEKLGALAGDDGATAKANAELALRLETELAKASLDRVARRDPHKTFHPMPLGKLQALAPAVDWKRYFEARGTLTETERALAGAMGRIDVTQPAFFERMSALLKSEPLDTWKRWLRLRALDLAAHLLGSAFVDEDFEFRTRYLRGARTLAPRWKRCVAHTDDDLGEALGQLFVEKNFPSDLKARAEAMLRAIQKAMAQEIDELAWMSPATKAQARAKLRAMLNKIGYPAKFRDYSKVEIRRDDFYGNVARAWRFEHARQLARIGKPVDRSEWEETPQTVDAYYDPQKNEMNFPAAVLLPPLFDGRIDDAPSYGDTGGCMGHELIHGFDDEGRKFDAKGNLKDWWTKPDAAEFERRAACVVDQYSGYVAVDDVHVNGKLTLGEDLADLGGLILAYRAWTAGRPADDGAKRDDLTPAQRFFVGYAQWDCANVRPESARLRARTDEHSPPRFRINGVVANMPEYANAFSCAPGRPMAKPPASLCKVW